MRRVDWAEIGINDAVAGRYGPPTSAPGLPASWASRPRAEIDAEQRTRLDEIRAAYHYGRRLVDEARERRRERAAELVRYYSAGAELGHEHEQLRLDARARLGL